MATTTPLPRFDFTPDEWPPYASGEPEGIADEVFETTWNGKYARGALRIVTVQQGYYRNHLTFFRIEGEDSTFMVAHHKRPSFREYFLQKSIGAHVNNAIASKEWGRSSRLHALETGGKEWLYLDCDGQHGCWNGIGGDGSYAPFWLNGQAFEAAMHDPNSDVRYALEWTHLSHEEQVQRVFHFADGEFATLQTLIRSIGTCERSLWTQNHSWIVAYLGSGELGLGTHWYEIRHDSHNNVRLRRWGKHIGAHLVLKKSGLSARRSCIREFYSRYLLAVELSSPTQHERLEAALFLREWGKDKIPPDELRLLLPKL